jgi:phage tail-like protein
MTKNSQIGATIELDPVIGWQSVMVQLSPTTPPGLAVDCVTGQPEKFVESLAPQLSYPVTLAHSGDRKLYLLDDGVARVKVLDLDRQDAFVTINGFGGKGRQARRFRGARGIALLADGSYVIADSGNHQVKIFSVYPHALLSIWGTGKPGSGSNEFNHPWKVAADACGVIYIADKGNGRIQRIHRGGRTLEPITGLNRPTGLALAPDGTLAVLDSPDVYLYAPGTCTGVKLDPAVPSASCLTFDDSGYLYVGTSTALVYKYETTAVGMYRYVGIGATGLDAQFLDLLWTPEAQLIGILLPRCSALPVLRSIPVCGSYLPSGTMTTVTLDSEIEKCVWDRIQLNATIPAGTLIQLTTQTAEADIWSPGAPLQAECSAYSSLSQNCAISLTSDNPDCLVQSRPGRYLRIQLQLQTNTIASPVLNSVQISFPRASYLQYLPALYQEDEQSRVFLDRFLRIFQTTFDGFDRTIDNMWMLFDPKSVPDAWYYWLASWIAFPINPLWTDQERRAALGAAGQLYRQRGTPAGIQQLVKQYSGVDVRLIEHFRLRQLIVLSHGPNGGVTLGSGTRLWSRDYYRRLQVGVYSRVGYFALTGEPEPDLEPLEWGANEFTLFFDCDPYQVAATRQKVEQVVEREKPAHTKANYAPVFSRMRIGVQSTLGVDTRIGEYTSLLLGTTGTLDYDSILSCSRTEERLMSQHATLRPQLGANTRLL